MVVLTVHDVGAAQPRPDPITRFQIEDTMHTTAFGYATPVRSFTHRALTARYLMTAMAIAAAALTAACGSDSATGPSAADVAGAYPMSAARGSPVPHTFTGGAGSKLTIEGGSISIDATGSYALTYKGKLNALTFDVDDFKIAGVKFELRFAGN
jgi:hypothetical protein